MPPIASPLSRTSGQRFHYDPALPFVECRRAQHSRACYRPHTHPALSVGAVDAGRSLLSVADAEPLALAAGDVVIIPPHRVHACNPAPDCYWSYRMLYLGEDWLRTLLDEGRADGVWSGRPERRRDPVCYRALCALTRLLSGPAAPAEKESALIAFVGGLLLPVPLPPACPPAWLEPMRQRLAQQCAHNWTVAELAAEAGLSRYHFIRTFSAHTGMTPHAYQIDCRINLARRQLRSGCSLADLACRLGFADQSHFQHAFKARVSVTPGEYLKQHRAA